MLHTGLRLAADLLQTQLPGEVLATVQADVWPRGSSNKFASGCPPRVMRLPACSNALRFDCVCVAVCFPLLPISSLSFSPTEEDWQARHCRKCQRFLEVARRPFRLARKYGRNGKS